MDFAWLSPIVYLAWLLGAVAFVIGLIRMNSPATARNGNFVPERARAETALQPGDRIEIVSPRHGG